MSNNNLSSNTSITSFSERYFHELDTVNFLASGKEWYGEEFSNAPGKSLTRNFTVNIPNVQNNSPIFFLSNCVARSVGASSRFDIKINNATISQLTINPTGGGLLDLFAQEAIATGNTTAAQNNITISYAYTPGSFNSQGWLNWFELFCRRNLSLSSVDQLMFRDWLTCGNNIGEFVVSNAPVNARFGK
jgi:hypothetical protein